MDNHDTIAAIATAPGRGGVAVIRISGPDAFRIASEVTGRPVDAKRAGRFFHATFFRCPFDHSDISPSFSASAGGETRTIIDDGLVLVFAAPSSYTGEDVVELQGHGGSIAPRRVLEACLSCGARLARRGEFTERAFLNGRLDLGAAEAVIDLVDARTARAADDAVERLGGAASAVLDRFYLDALDFSAQLEHALDVSEDELPEEFIDAIASSVDSLAQRIDRKLTTAREGRILREGALVVMAGAPNAGKSSLLNALLGTRRAIVSDEAGTTRDSIEEWIEIEGWPVRLVDTAGLRTAAGAIEAEGVSRARELIAQADLVLRLVPADSDEAVPDVTGNEILVRSKCDRGSGRGGLRVSARTGEGIEALRRAIAAHLSAVAQKGDEESGADVTTRQQECLMSARAALDRMSSAIALPDLVLAANEARQTAESLGRVLGKIYSDDLLDALFSRFCVGK